MQRTIILLTLTLMLATSVLAAAQTKKATPSALPKATLSFASDIQPILSDKCFQCHGPDTKTRKADLRLDTPEGAFAKLASGQAIVPGKPERSRAYLRMVEKNPALRMPPPDATHKMTKAETEKIRLWIVNGAKWEKHWAFLPPTRPKLPAVKNAAWATNPIDRFLLARLEKEGLKPSPPATREKLLRRLTLDLTGLPPTLAELDGFLADKSPNAYEKVVDRLLASPRFGERMVWDWLDAARYSDTNGFQEDRSRPMWRWRDWVIEAYNSNKPFDKFTVEQLAGDLLPNPSIDQRIATGFNRNHMLNGEGGRIPEESRVEYVVDRVDTTSTVWLGLTMGCARCHDHKYDPFSQKEYYRLYAYFNNIAESGAVDRNGAANPVLPLPTPEQTAQLQAVQQQITELQNQANVLERGSVARAELEKQIDAKRKSINDISNGVLLAMVMEERTDPRKTFVLDRGAYDKYGEQVTSGVPTALNPLPQNATPNRLGLANWLVSPQNPLTARVTVNRIWQTFFGMGLVKTTEDFGIQGERPSHPELLDWLATEFVREGWNLKSLIKKIVTSAAYRQSSTASPNLIERDPSNRLLARAPRYRLSAPTLRDQSLYLSGLLVEKIGGPPVKPYQPEGVWEDFSYGKIVYQQDKGEALYRRSLYTFWRRSVAPTEFFDTAARRVCQVRVERTNTPLQALILLNSTTHLEAARVWATKLLKQESTASERLRTAFRMATSRYPTPQELTILTRNLQKQQARYGADPTAAEKLVSIGDMPRNREVNATDLAAYTSVLNLILNLDEAMNRE